MRAQTYAKTPNERAAEEARKRYAGALHGSPTSESSGSAKSPGEGRARPRRRVLETLRQGSDPVIKEEEEDREGFPVPDSGGAGGSRSPASAATPASPVEQEDAPSVSSEHARLAEHWQGQRRSPGAAGGDEGANRSEGDESGAAQDEGEGQEEEDDDDDDDEGGRDEQEASKGDGDGDEDEEASEMDMAAELATEAEAGGGEQAEDDAESDLESVGQTLNRMMMEEKRAAQDAEGQRQDGTGRGEGSRRERGGGPAAQLPGEEDAERLRNQHPHLYREMFRAKVAHEDRVGADSERWEPSAFLKQELGAGAAQGRKRRSRRSVGRPAHATHASAHRNTLRELATRNRKRAEEEAERLARAVARERRRRAKHGLRTVVSTPVLPGVRVESDGAVVLDEARIKRSGSSALLARRLVELDGAPTVRIAAGATGASTEPASDGSGGAAPRSASGEVPAGSGLAAAAAARRARADRMVQQLDALSPKRRRVRVPGESRVGGGASPGASARASPATLKSGPPSPAARRAKLQELREKVQRQWGEHAVAHAEREAKATLRSRATGRGKMPDLLIEEWRFHCDILRAHSELREDAPQRMRLAVDTVSGLRRLDDFVSPDVVAEARRERRAREEAARKARLQRIRAERGTSDRPARSPEQLKHVTSIGSASKKDIVRAKATFMELDADNSGTVELHELLASPFIRSNPQLLDQIRRCARGGLPLSPQWGPYARTALVSRTCPTHTTLPACSSFQTVDKDQSGSLELGEFLAILFPKATSVELDEMEMLLTTVESQRRLARESEEVLISPRTRDELYALFKVRGSPPSAPLPPPPQRAGHRLMQPPHGARPAVQAWDADDSGTLELSELKEAAEGIVSEDFIEELMRKFDDDGNQVLDVEEFINLMGDAFRSDVDREREESRQLEAR